MKRIVVFLILLCSSFCFFAETNSLIVQFVKGNIAEKISAVQNASGEEGTRLAREALSFVIANEPLLGNDRDLSALAVAGILAVPDKYASSLSSEQKAELANDFCTIFKNFSDSNIKIAVISKATQLYPSINDENLTNVFNSYILNSDKSSDIAVVQHAVQAVGIFGDDKSFAVLHNRYMANSFPAISKDIETSMAALTEKSADYIFNIISDGDAKKIRPIFDVVQKNEKNNNNFKAEIAETTLLLTINNAGSQKQLEEEMISLQIDSLRVLAKLNWTHAASAAANSFDSIVNAHERGLVKTDDFIEVIDAVAKLSPIESSQKLSKYLSDLNGKKEKNNAPSNSVVKAVISSLGSLGNKQAFDALLATTYLDYPDDIVALARDSLARLKW